MGTAVERVRNVTDVINSTISSLKSAASGTANIRRMFDANNK